MAEEHACETTGPNGSGVPLPHPAHGVQLLCQCPAQTLVLVKGPVGMTCSFLDLFSGVTPRSPQPSTFSPLSCFPLPESIFPTRSQGQEQPLFSRCYLCLDPVSANPSHVSLAAIYPHGASSDMCFLIENGNCLSPFRLLV